MTTTELDARATTSASERLHQAWLSRVPYRPVRDFIGRDDLTAAAGHSS